ncbi:hypothetical protein [uncultured Gammaproteobacteria bacterium]|jgi:hypothetical protein|uniref:Uncharacterized protein n=3 Tax=sulfur-oxidizing symbionts TaxID=32036 RepID=A0ACA8ZNX2_9GAMM|nr:MULTISPECIES: hypothetical protein [sulfur-oxidizing symbionts]CAC9499473.1 hypothetical protein [uncultured Gammaproteobacteria bacterium]CAB5497764.1 hypothetical protein AZO1586R_652 [Bathymodiolus azoricus thioautotrophic gill symbiont]CAB5505683.1 hypothetical protein AZO1586I_1494 [Bathymodiolus thermophilus thioautotrophic gill symbiont]CAC9506753.1 hypothetical protein [uncultured Gammaproteobacteria bacterium]CAC9507256.1 hypothetical protein [uncultured Gammaproteobacteria bacteri
MKKTLFIAILIATLSVKALSPNEMLVIVGAVKYYNENCEGLNAAGYRKMNQGLKRFKMHRTPVPVLEQHPLAVSSYQTAKKFGCEGTKQEAYKAGFGQYIN